MPERYVLHHNVRMGSILQITDVPEDGRRELEARAAARGQSLNAYLLDLIDREVSRPTVAEVLDRAAERAERANAELICETQSRVHGRVDRDAILRVLHEGRDD